MLSWSVFFLIIALIAALLGFSSIAGAAAGIAKILFGVFLILFLISLFRWTASCLRSLNIRMALRCHTNRINSLSVPA